MVWRIICKVREYAKQVAKSARKLNHVLEEIRQEKELEGEPVEEREAIGSV
jgi:hypothetical protein